MRYPIKAFGALSITFLLSSCGIVEYPGQPGAVTNGYSKIELEYLEEPGLFVYETTYDNRAGAAGVGTIVTRLYPNAKTFTSNVRTNADGTLYRNKSTYNGSELQMISIPPLKQVHVSPNAKVSFLLGYQISMDEVDDKNTAEENLFKPSDLVSELLPAAFEAKKLRWELLRAGTLTRTGTLSYEVTSVDLKDHKFTPSRPVLVETGLFQNSVRTNLSGDIKAEFQQFLETAFPKGFSGAVVLHVKGYANGLTLNLATHTLKTAEAAGYKIVKATSVATIEELLVNLRKNPAATLNQLSESK